MRWNGHLDVAAVVGRSSWRKSKLRAGVLSVPISPAWEYLCNGGDNITGMLRFVLGYVNFL